MTLSRTDLEDLTAGTIVEYRRDVWPVGSCIRGPLESFGSDRSLYILTGLFGVRQENGDPYEPRAEITVIAEAEPETETPLYVNHPRTEPVPGDVALSADDDGSESAWYFLDSLGSEWFDKRGYRYGRDELPARLRLLVDGETREVVR